MGEQPAMFRGFVPAADMMGDVRVQCIMAKDKLHTQIGGDGINIVGI